VVIPMLLFGVPSGHDFEFHLDSWIEVLGQWRQGILYPRWAEMAHYGYGEARFIFYPPASWMLGGVLGTVLPWKVVPGVFSWIALTAAGWSMFLLARRWLGSADAMFAAALYAANPYHIVIVYWRSAFAELLASILLPLVLLFVLRSADEGRRMIMPLALVVAAAWLTNAPSAVMVNYSLALLVVVVAIVRRSPRVLLYGAAAVILGIALAAFYVVPAAYEEKWVNIAEVLSPGVRPQDNFLFTATSDPDHNRFNLLVSIIASMEIVVVMAGAWLSRNSRRERPALWSTLVAWSGAAILLMLPFTLLLWEHLPKLRFMQLPWRWLLALNVVLAVLVTLGWRRWTARAVLCAAMLAVIVLVWMKVQPPWWDHAADIVEIRDNIRQGTGYEGTDEYVPAGGDAYEVKQAAPKVIVQGGSSVRIHVQQWAPESKVIEADVKKPAKLLLRLFNYPAWRVSINGRAVQTETEETTGQMILPVNPGDNIIRIVFVRTWDRTVGGAVSLVAWLGLGAAYSWRRRRTHGLQTKRDDSELCATF
jgi:hypothetical protein